MIISEKAKLYLEKNNIKELTIVPKMKIEFNGCSCVGGTQCRPEAQILINETDLQDTRQIHSSNVLISIKNSIVDAFGPDTELIVKTGLKGKRLSIKNFYYEKIDRCDTKAK